MKLRFFLTLVLLTALLGLAKAEDPQFMQVAGIWCATNSVQPFKFNERNDTYTSYKKLLKKLQKRVTQEPRTGRQLKLRRKLSKLRKRVKKARRVCRQAFTNGQLKVTATPTPSDSAPPVDQPEGSHEETQFTPQPSPTSTIVNTRPPEPMYTPTLIPSSTFTHTPVSTPTHSPSPTIDPSTPTPTSTPTITPTIAFGNINLQGVPEKINITGNVAGLALADLNSNNISDVVLLRSSPNNDLSIYYSDGLGSFDSSRQVATGNLSNPRGPLIADLNGDNRLDLVVFEEATVYTFLQGADNNFYISSTVNPSYRVDAVSLARLNADNIPDLVITSQSGVNADQMVVAISLGIGNGSFGAETLFIIDLSGVVIPGGRPTMALGDFNGDNMQDLAICRDSGTTLWQALGDGMGGIGAFSTRNIAPCNDLKAAALNSDNRDDLVLTQFGFGADFGIGVLEGTISGLENSIERFVANGENYTTLAVLDQDSDGDNDVLLAGQPAHSFVVFYNDGNANFSPSQSYRLENVSYIDHGVLDQDGRADDFAAYSPSSLFLVNGSVSTEPPSSIVLSTTSYDELHTADLNQDGRADFVGLITASDKIETWLADVNFGYAKVDTDNRNAIFKTMGIAELSGDNTPEVVVGTSNGYVVFYNRGNGTYGDNILTNLGESVEILRLGDLNGDTFADAVYVGNPSTSYKVMLREENGLYDRFGAPQSTNVGSPIQALALADISGDGLLDLIIACSDPERLLVHRGQGNGTFEPWSTSNEIFYPYQVAAGSFFGNQNNSIVSLGVNFGIYLQGFIVEPSDGTLSQVFTRLLSGTGNLLLATDIDNDGDDDLIKGDNLSDQIEIVLSNQTTTMSPTTTLNSANTIKALSDADFSGDGKSDLLVSTTKGVELILGK